MQDKQPIIAYGELYNVFTGEPLNNSATDAYNVYTRQINNTYSQETKDRLLDARHSYILKVSYLTK